MTTQLYAMRCENFIKVGIAKNVDERLRTLQTMVPFPVEVLRTVSYPNTRLHGSRTINNALLVEREIHIHLCENNLHHLGEWFLEPAKVLEKYDELTDLWNPNYIFDRSLMFVSLGDEICNLDTVARRTIECALGPDGKYVVERFRHHEPRKLSFLLGNNIERVSKMIRNQS
jgi:hypothetical protein